jgi:hypothetical protein
MTADMTHTIKGTPLHLCSDADLREENEAAGRLQRDGFDVNELGNGKWDAVKAEIARRNLPTLH